jgi:hypothetical protein
MELQNRFQEYKVCNSYCRIPDDREDLGPTDRGAALAVVPFVRRPRRLLHVDVPLTWGTSRETT